MARSESRAGVTDGDVSRGGEWQLWIYSRGAGDGRFRRILPTPARSGGGRLIERTPAVQASRRERVKSALGRVKTACPDESEQFHCSGIISCRILCSAVAPLSDKKLPNDCAISFH